jgi:tape measure domain-containing protein
MAELYFKVHSDVEKVVALRQEIERLDRVLSGIDVGKNKKEAKEIIKQIGTLQTSLESTTEEAARMASVMQKEFRKKILEASEAANFLTSKVIAQKAVIATAALEVRKLTQEYKQSGNNQALLTSLNKATANLNTQRETLIQLQAAQGQARLSAKAMREEYSLYKKQGDIVVGTNINILQSLKQLAGAYVGVEAIKSFGMAIIDARKQMQMLEASFRTLLGSKGASDKMLSELKQFEIESPLTMSDVTSAAQMMLGFNISAEKVLPTLKTLGDISMGNSQRFGSLALAFSQMSSAGKLMGQDLNQMINAGFNPLQQMSQDTGKSMAVLRKEMGEGAISSEMVTQAFMNATSEGGRFFGMTKEGAKTIQGAQAQLEGAIQKMLNELGESSEDFIKEGYAGAQSLVENYQEVGKILGGIIITYGVYKAALMAALAVESAREVVKRAALHSNVQLTATQTTLTAVTHLATTANKKLAASFALLKVTNPYYLIAATVAAAAAGIYALTTAESELEKVQKQAAKSFNDAETAAGEEIWELNRLRGQLAATTQGTKEYDAIKKTIIDKFGKYHEGLATELDDVNKLEAAYQTLTTGIYDAARAREYNKGIQSADEEYTQSAGKTLENLREGLKENPQSQANPKEAARLEELLRQAAWSDQPISEDLLNQTKNFGGGASRNLIGQIKNPLFRAASELSDAKQKRSDQETALQNSFGAAYAPPPPPTTTEPPANTTPESEADKKAREKREKAAEEAGKLAEASAKKREEAVANATVAAKKAGLDRVLAQNKLNYDREIAQIDEEEKKLKEKRKEAGLGDLTGEQSADFTTRKDVASQNLLRNNNAAIEEDAKRQKETLDNLLAAYQDFDAQKEALIAKSNTDKEGLLAGLTGDNFDAVFSSIAEVDKRLKEGLSAINVAELKETINWEEVFGDLSRLTDESLSEVERKIKEFITTSGKDLSSVDLKTLTDQLDKISKFRIEKNPFKEALKSLKDYIKAVKEAKTEQDKQTAASNLTASFDGIIQVTKEVEGNLNSLLDAAEGAGMEVSDTLRNTIDGLSKTVEGGLNLASSIATGNVMGIINGSMQLLTGIMTFFKSDDSRLLKQIEDYKSLIGVLDTVIEKQKELLSTLSGPEAVEVGNKTEESIKAQMQAGKDALSAWGNGGRNGWEKFWGYGNTNAEDFNEQNHGEYTSSYADWDGEDFLGYKKYTVAAKGIGMGIEAFTKLDAEGMAQLMRDMPAAFAQLPQEAKDFANAVIEGTANLEDLDRILNESLTGTTLDGLTSEMEGLVSDFDTMFEDVGDSAEEYLKKAIMRGLSITSLKPKLKEWQAAFAEANKDGKIDEDEAAALVADYKEIFKTGKEQLNEALSIAGISNGDLASQEATRGAWEGITYDQAGELSGRFLSLQITGSEIKSIADESRTILVNSLLELQQISKNTGDALPPLRETARAIERVAEKLETL